MNSPERDPQNPFASFVVSASAGSGKTYQLSRRFLQLVGAGASPESILTVTFMKKAAEDMRSQILQLAAQLASDRDLQQEFLDKQSQFSNWTKRRLPLRTPQETSEIILQSSRRLRIVTIDSAFLQWVEKFPWECRLSPDEELMRRTLVDPGATEPFDESGWQHVCERLYANRELLDAFRITSHGSDLGDLQRRVAGLAQHRSLLWSLAAKGIPGRLRCVTEDLTADDNAQLTEDLRCLAAQLKEPLRSTVEQAIAYEDWNAVVDSALMTRKDLTVSKTYFRGKKREQWACEIERVESLLHTFVGHQRSRRLDITSELLFGLFDVFEEGRRLAKERAASLEFSDLARGCQKLFRTDEAAGARYLIHRTTSHLMLDEFQDTSWLSWDIFSSMIEDMMALEADLLNEGAPRPSVFIVGDRKQSIYGFREADPAVVDAAEELVRNLGGHCVSMSTNYRSRKLVLDYVNQCFAPQSRQLTHLHDFPHHTVPEQADETVGPASIIVAKEIEATQSESAPEREARFVAESLANTLKRQTRFTPNDCAILYRYSKHADLLEAALRRVGLPCRREEQRGYFHRPEVHGAISLLRWLASPADLLSLLSFLRSPLARLQDQGLLSALEEVKQDRSEAPLQALEIVSNLSTQAPMIGRFLKHSLAESGRRLPHATLMDMLARLDVARAFSSIYESAEASLALSNLYRLIELCLDLEKDGASSMASVVDRLTQTAARNEIGNASASGQAVTLMTIHKSKGLEYPIVVLTGTGEGWQKRDRFWAKDVEFGEGLLYVGTQSEMPPSGPYQRALALLDEEIHQECQRLLYVSLTRAKNHLIISGHKGRDSKGSFLADLRQAAIDLGAQETSIGEWNILKANAGRKTAQDDATIDRPTDDANQIAAASPLSIPEHIPYQTYTLAPKGGAATTENPTRSIPTTETGTELFGQERVRRYARYKGLLIHRLLEWQVRGHPSFAQQSAGEWQKIWHENANPTEVPPQPSIVEQIIAESTQAVRKLTESHLWRDLTDNALRLRPEQDIGHLDNGRWTRGRIDLLIEHTDRTIIVDFKTAAHFPNKRDQETLRRWCRECGFEQQLTHYLETIGQTYPHRRTEGWIVWPEKAIGVCVLEHERINDRPPISVTLEPEPLHP